MGHQYFEPANFIAACRKPLVLQDDDVEAFIRHIVFHIFVLITQDGCTVLNYARDGNAHECVRILQEFIGIEYIYITY